ncbi:MAG: hypothetical protein ABIQ16_06235 [Polyangiaceae bacterium]
MSAPKGRIDFRYDASNDAVIATPRWIIETEADVADWYDQYSTYLQKYGRKMDMVIVLDFFEIKPGIGVVWGEARGRIHKQFTRFNYRVHATNRVKLFVNTSGVRYDVATEEAATIEDAIEGILAARRAANKGT